MMTVSSTYLGTFVFVPVGKSAVHMECSISDEAYHSGTPVVAHFSVDL